MAYKRTKKMLLSVAAVSIGAIAPMACASSSLVGDIAVPPDASDASDSGNKCGVLGKCAPDAGPDSSYPDVVVGAMPLDASKD